MSAWATKERREGRGWIFFPLVILIICLCVGACVMCVCVYFDTRMNVVWDGNGVLFLGEGGRDRSEKQEKGSLKGT